MFMRLNNPTPSSISASSSPSSPPILNHYRRLDTMTTDHHHHHHPGPTLPPLRPLSLQVPLSSAPQFSQQHQHHHHPHHITRRPTLSSSPVSQSHPSYQPPSTPVTRSIHRSPPQSYSPNPTTPLRRQTDLSKSTNQSAPLRSAHHQQNTIDNQTPRNSFTSNQPHSTPSESKLHRHNTILKRTASRAELDQRASRGQDEFVHSEPPPSQPIDEPSSILKPDPSYSHDQLSAPEDEVFVKPEYLTPHLPPQSLPAQPNHHSPPPTLDRSNSSGSRGGCASSPRSPDSESRASHHSRPRSIINPALSHQSQRDSGTLGHSNSLKKRRVTITDERSLVNPRSGGYASLNPYHQSSSSPDTRADGRNSFSKYTTSEPVIEPVSPLVIGFNQPHDPSAMQQVATTMKLREEQKRLIEQRRNSFTTQSSLNSFSFSGTHSSGHPPLSQSSRCSPGTVRPNGARTSISKPVPPVTNNCGNNGIMKLLSHQSLVAHSPSTQQQPQRSHPPPPPVVNLPPIDETTRKRNSIPYLSHRAPPVSSTSSKSNHSIDSKSASNSDTLNVDTAGALHSSGSDSTIASRRGEVVREKVKNLTLAPQSFRPHLIAQPSVKSAPIRSGFLQATAPNGEVVKTPLIARTNLAGGTAVINGSPAKDGQHTFPTRSNANSSSVNHSHHQPSRLSCSTSSGPATAHPNLGVVDSYGKGLERRMTMHSGTLMQVPTLSHALMNSNPTLAPTQPSPSRGRPGGRPLNPGAPLTHSIPLMPGPKTSTPSLANSTNSIHHQQENMDTSRNLANGIHPHNVSTGIPSQPPLHGPQQPCFQQQLPNRVSSPEHLHPPHLARPRHSIGSANVTGLASGIPPKHMFLQLFDTFYDSLSDSKILQSNLEDQIRRSAQLLNLLQQSSTVFEKMLDDRMAGIQKEYTRDLQILETRIERLEAKVADNEATIDPHGEDDSSLELKVNELAGATNKSPNAHHTQGESSGRPSSTASVPGVNGIKEERTIISRLEKLERDIPQQNEILENYASSRGGFSNPGHTLATADSKQREST